jgi:transglutaminase-like putative cysteine protease
MVGYPGRSARVGLPVLALVVLMLLTSHRYPRLHEQARVAKLSERMTEITYSLTVNDIPGDAGGMTIWVPVPLDNERQRLESFEIFEDLAYRIVQEPEYGNWFLVSDIGGAELSGRTEIATSVKFRVRRYAVSPLRQQCSAEMVPQHNLARYLAADRLIPVEGKIAEEARLAAGQVQGPLRQTRLLYVRIVSTLAYDKSGTGWGRGDAIYACDVRRGNCTDFHSLFIGQARAMGIPARFIMGLPLPEDESEGTIPGYHCWGEFYLPDKGWLPVDASEASKYPEKKELFFGGLDEHRVAFSVGRDIKLPGSAAEPLNYVIYPHIEIDGRVHEGVVTDFYFKDHSNRDEHTVKLVQGTIGKVKLAPQNWDIGL